jgi:2-keto-4-pentenoate hydratase/2-oxohepta-3-ene-1,7-dioic acid hydratase in catechol pathway
MKLATFVRDGHLRFGCVEQDRIRDMHALLPAGGSLRDLLSWPVELISQLSSAVDAADIVSLEAVRLVAPILNPSKFLGLGGNYRAHLEEVQKIGISAGKNQLWFNKQVSCINGPFDPIHLPRVSQTLDYEGELGVVIGKRCRAVKAADAWSVIAGYTICNDVSVREWQLRSSSHTLGKSFDTHGPTGPWIVTADEIADPHSLLLTVTVNGELRQKGSTGEMIHSIPEMIEELTTAFTLEPGDILSTGTPSGIGALMDPPRYLRAGDVVRVEIEGIGHIENPVIDEPVPARPVTTGEPIRIR